jgi:hypothetical protein
MTRRNAASVVRGVIVGLALPVLASPAPGWAQTADEIVARHLAARGGLERIRSVQTLRMTGTATTGTGARVVLSRETRRPDRVRLEFTYQGVTGVYACDAGRGWRVSPFDGDLDPRPMPPSETQAVAEQADFDGPFVDAAAKGVTVEFVGRAPVSGRDAFKFKLTSKTGTVRYYYLDAETYLLVRTDAPRVRRGQTLQVETTFADYKEVGGLRFPHLIESAARGRPTRLRIIVDSVEVNPSIDDARFRVPEGGRSQ